MLRTHSHTCSHPKRMAQNLQGVKKMRPKKMRPSKFFSSRRKTKGRLRLKNQVFPKEFSFLFGSPGTANALTHSATLPDYFLVHMCNGRALIKPGAPFKAGRIWVKMEWSLISAKTHSRCKVKVKAKAKDAKPRCHSKKLLRLFFPHRWSSLRPLGFGNFYFSSVCF